MASAVLRIFLLGLLFVSTQSQSSTQNATDTSTTNQQPLKEGPIKDGQSAVNQIVSEAQQSVSKQDTRPSDIPTEFFMSDGTLQQDVASKSFTPIGFTGMGVPAAWQIRQPGGDQVQTLPISGPIIPQVPVQVPAQVAVQLPAQVPMQPVQQPQPSPQPTQAAVASTIAPSAPEPKPDPFNLFGGPISPLGLGLLGGEGMGGLFGGELFGGLGGAMGGGLGLLGGLAGSSGSGAQSGGGLLGDLFGGGSGGSGGAGGAGNILQSLMLMRMLGLGADAPDPPARPRGARGRAGAMSQMSPIQRLAMMELRRLLGGGPGPRPGPGPYRDMGPRPGPGPYRDMGPRPRDYPPNYPPDYPPNEPSGGFSNELQSPVVRGPPPPSFRGGRRPGPPPFAGSNGIPRPPPGRRVARSMNSAVDQMPAGKHPEVLSGKFMSGKKSQNNQGQGPEPIEIEAQQQQGVANSKLPTNDIIPKSQPMDIGGKDPILSSGTKVAASETQFRVFGTQEPAAAATVIQQTAASAPSNAPLDRAAETMSGMETGTFDSSRSRSLGVSQNTFSANPSQLPPVGTAGETIDPVPTQATNQFGSTRSFTSNFFTARRGSPVPALPSTAPAASSITSISGQSSSTGTPENLRQLLTDPLIQRRMRLLAGRTNPMAGLSAIGAGNADVRADRADRMADYMDNLQAMNPIQRALLTGGGLMQGLGAGIGGLGTGLGNLGALFGASAGGTESLGTSAGGTGSSSTPRLLSSLLGGSSGLGGGSTSSSSPDILSLLLGGRGSSTASNSFSGMGSGSSNSILGILGNLLGSRGNRSGSSGESPLGLTGGL